METKGSFRNHYLDWLRVIGILTVFVYHSTRFFNNETWHVKNATWYPGLDAWNMFAVTWMMPLMFVISGASLFYAVGKGGAGKFFQDKVLRLLVPLLVVALTHASIQVYFDRQTHGLFTGSYLQFLSTYYQGIFDGDDPSRGNFALTGMHMWYVYWLFLFTIILYPLMRWLKGRGRVALAWLSDALSFPGGVYALALPTLLLQSFVNPDAAIFSEDEAGWPVIIYLWLVVSGFVVISNPRLMESIRRLRWTSLVIALVLMGVSAYILLSFDDPLFGTAFYVMAVALRVFFSWSFVLMLLGFAIQHLSHSTPFLEHASPAVLPFYILHQTVLLCVGYFVVQWAIPDLLKWVMILLVSFPIIMFFYEYLVRRYNVMRFLFGMKVIPKQQEKKAVKTTRKAAPAR